MSDLPDRWQRSTVGALCAASYGKGLPKDLRKETGKIPVYGSAGIAGHHDEALVEGPVVVVGRKGNAGAVHLSAEACWPIDTTYYLKPPEGIDQRFLAHQLANLRLGQLDSSTAIPSLRREDLEAASVVVPPLPEQRRIVAAIEEQFAHLDAAEVDLRSALARATRLMQTTLIASIPCTDVPSDWVVVTVDEAGRTDLGRQRSPKYHSGPSMRPYLRVANVFEDRLDLSDVMEMDFDDDAWSKYRLIDGDILLNEGQSPHLVGRPAMYRGDPEAVAFTNSLIRFHGHEDVDPDWALLVFRRHLHARRFMKEASITTNIAHLALKRFRTVEFPKPPLPTQRRLVRAIRSDLDGIERVRGEIEATLGRAIAARRSILAAAFSGQLVPQDPSDEPASALLKRIAVERAAAKPSRRKKKAAS